MQWLYIYSWFKCAIVKKSQTKIPFPKSNILSEGILCVALFKNQENLRYVCLGCIGTVHFFICTPAIVGRFQNLYFSSISNIFEVCIKEFQSFVSCFKKYYGRRCV